MSRKDVLLRRTNILEKKREEKKDYIDILISIDKLIWCINHLVAWGKPRALLLGASSELFAGTHACSGMLKGGAHT